MLMRKRGLFERCYSLTAGVLYRLINKIDLISIVYLFWKILLLQHMQSNVYIVNSSFLYKPSRYFKLPNLKSFKLLLLLCLFIVYAIPKQVIFYNSSTLCLHKLVFHFDCSVCGMTRAIYCLLHGEFQRSIEYNFAIIPFSILVISQFAQPLISSNNYTILNNISRRVFYVFLIIIYLIRLFDYLQIEIQLI